MYGRRSLRAWAVWNRDGTLGGKRHDDVIAVMSYAQCLRLLPLEGEFVIVDNQLVGICSEWCLYQGTTRRLSEPLEND